MNRYYTKSKLMKKLDFLPNMDVTENQLEYDTVLDSYIIVLWHLFNIWDKIPAHFKIEINNLIIFKLTEVFYNYYKYERRIFKSVKIKDFEDFWIEDSWRKSPLLHNSLNLPAIKNSIALAITAITSPIAISLFGCDDTQVKTEQFSKELANYVTSHDIVSNLSNEIGKPKRRETQEEFVVRAGCVLREILKEKLSV